MVIPCIWNRTFDFHEGLAKVQDSEGKMGYIDTSGEVRIPCQWINALFFSEGMAGVQDSNSKWGFIDKTGKVVIPCQWSNVQWFINGVVRVQNMLCGEWYDVDINGQEWRDTRLLRSTCSQNSKKNRNRRCS